MRYNLEDNLVCHFFRKWQMLPGCTSERRGGGDDEEEVDNEEEQDE